MYANSIGSNRLVPAISILAVAKKRHCCRKRKLKNENVLREFKRLLLKTIKNFARGFH